MQFSSTCFVEKKNYLCRQITTMKQSSNLLLILLLVVLSSCKSKNETFESLSRLEGQWSMKFDQSEVMEQWRLVNDTLMEGKSYEITGTDSVVSETVHLVLRGSEIFYIPTTAGQNDGNPVPFKLAKHEGDVFSFENPEHDFPTVITYNFINKSTLKASISGTIRGEVRSMDFDYVKTK